MQIYKVGQVTRYLRQLLESDAQLTDLWISGEVSNLVQSAAGHLYFTLKDADSQLRCVLFRRERAGDQLENGMAIVAHGQLSIYETRGELQFYVDLVQSEGVGLLHMEFERLKVKLEDEGLFDLAHKRELPTFPQRIGLVTSPTGAALYDIINIISRRYPLVELILSPTLVQGNGAADNIVEALQALDRADGIDLVILARGGGSLEELWAFNEERVARAIYNSRAPVISGVGHDTDFTIADFVADRRAPTPSAAAELAVPDRSELESRIESWQRLLVSTVQEEISRHHDQLKYGASRLKVLSPDLNRYRQRIDDFYRVASFQSKSILAIRREQLRSCSLQISSLSPIRTLGRGYAIVEKSATGEVVSRLTQVKRGDAIDVQVSDGGFKGRVTSRKKGNGRQRSLF